MGEDTKQIYIQILKNHHEVGLVELRDKEFRVCIVVVGSTLKDCIPAIYRLNVQRS